MSRGLEQAALHFGMLLVSATVLFRPLIKWLVASLHSGPPPPRTPEHFTTEAVSPISSSGMDLMLSESWATAWGALVLCL